MEEPLFSVRMRASLAGKHLAGAERIVGASSVGEVTAELMNRGVAGADSVHCNLERIDDEAILYEKLPDISTFNVKHWETGRQLARRLLAEALVPEAVAEGAVQLLAGGAAHSGHVMRGAVLMDVRSGKRLEADRERGVRASRMDLALAAREKIQGVLNDCGLGHYRVCEALVLAGKVLHAPGVVAELCWSDSPDYVTGYVSSPLGGYQRISVLKPAGNTLGGRVFFVDSTKTETTALVDFLERQPILFTSLGQITAPQVWTGDE